MPYDDERESGRHRTEPAGRTVAYEHRPDLEVHLGLAAKGSAKKIDRMVKRTA